MKIQYVAYDGKIFDDKVECHAYEVEKILMGNFLGGRTFNFKESAYFVYIPNNETLKLFQEIYSESGDAKNINDVGFYIWDDIESKYIKLNLNTFNNLKIFLREYCN